MKAFDATYPVDSRLSEGEGDTLLHLPQVACETCGDTWSESEVWFPSLSLVKGTDPSEFDEDETVNVLGLEALRRRLKGMKGRKLNLVPGTGIGPVHARIPARATDFVWCGFRLLATRRAVIQLAKRGVYLPYGPAVVQKGKEKTLSYLALELNPVPLLDRNTLQRTTLTLCKACGGVRARDPRAAEDVVGGYVRSRMPKNVGLVRVHESFVTLATDEMIDAVKTLGLTGLMFKEAGTYAEE